MNEQQVNHLIPAKSVDEVTSLLQSSGGNAIPVAGATWVMRAPIRLEKSDHTFISLSRIKELRELKISDNEISIGCMATHEQIANALWDVQDMQGLRQAANKSANPAIRNSATIGGNICTTEFSASDLVPALLALKASVEIRSTNETTVLPMEKFVSSNRLNDNANLLTRVVVARSQNVSAHERLTLRKAGEYSVANLSISVAIDQNEKFRSACIAIGSVESNARRWTSLEEALIGKEFSAAAAKDIATKYLDEFTGRDATDAPGWYRTKVLPSLLGKAVDNLKSQTHGAGQHGR